MEADMTANTGAAALDIPALYDRWVDTFATLDPERIAALCTPESVLDIHVGQPPFVGRDALIEGYRGIFAQWPNFGFDVVRTFHGPDHWVLDWYLTSDLSAPDGTPVAARIRCLDIVHVAPNGLVRRKDTYVDNSHVTAVLTAHEDRVG